GLAQANDRLLADVVERVAQAHRGGGLALARGRGRHRRHQDKLAVLLPLEGVEVFERHLRLVMAVGLEVLLGDAELFARNPGDALQLRRLGDFDVGGHGADSPRGPAQPALMQIKATSPAGPGYPRCGAPWRRWSRAAPAPASPGRSCRACRCR